jgi:hypothetical protein
MKNASLRGAGARASALVRSRAIPAATAPIGFPRHRLGFSHHSGAAEAKK